MDDRHIVTNELRDTVKRFADMGGPVNELSREELAAADKAMICRHPGYGGGRAGFVNHPRIAVWMLMDYLAGGASVDEFLESYPFMNREEVVAMIRLAKARLESVP